MSPTQVCQLSIWGFILFHHHCYRMTSSYLSVGWVLDNVLEMCKDNLSLWMTHISRMSCFCLWRDIRACYLLILLHSVPHVSILMASLFLGCSHSVSQPQFWNTSQGLFSFWNPNCQCLSSISVRTTKLISQAPHCRFCVDEYLERKLYHISASFLL